MAFTTNLNIPPYYNDYDETKNYHQILFRPSTAVQARELTQLQNIFQTQVERFGQWAFKNGDIVQGCTVNDLSVVPYVFLADSDASANGYDSRTFVNCIAVSASSNLRARVLFANVGFQANYPNCNIIYLNYINTGTSGQKIFSNSELIQFYNSNSSGLTLVTNNANVYTLANVAGTNATGNAHGITVSEGIVFLDGAFIKVETPTFGLVNNFGTFAGNNVVGFQAVETIITENQDSTLYDNALGYPNENAPGAHRLKITPTLVSLDPVTAANTVGFNPIAVYNFGSIVSKSSDSQIYSAINDAISTRIYEEAGNYVVNPFTIDTITNSGDTNVSPANSDYVFAKINPGTGYSQGSRVTIDKSIYVNMRRGTDTQTNKEQQITFNYGNYFQLNEVSGSFDFDHGQTVTLYDTAQISVTTRNFLGLTPSGNIVGTAMVRCFTYNGSGTPGSNNALYNLHVFNIKLNSGYNTNQIKSVYYNSGSTKAIADLATPGLINASQKEQLFSFGVAGVKSLRDSSNNNNTEYTYRKKSSTSLLNSGSATVTITTSSPGGIDILPYGLGQLNDLQAYNINITPTSTGYSAALSGTVSVSPTSNAVVGTSTTFLSNFAVSDVIYDGVTTRVITSIANNIYMTVDAPFTIANSAAAYYKAFPAGKQIPISLQNAGSYANVANTTSFTVYLNTPPSSSIPVNVTYDVLRTATSPANKVIKKNRFVTINAAANPSGPWCLGFSDVQKVTAVYSTNNGIYSSNTQVASDITSIFTFDTGQKDTHYDLAYLRLKPGTISLTGQQNLLVQLDYFTPNTTPGIGFFTVESYPIDDANTANTNAIQTKDIPLYVDEKGAKTPLRDFVDFRPVAVPTALDTGNIDISNTSQVTAAIALAAGNTNPSNVVSFGTSSLNVPSYGKNLQADITFYIPRRDIVYITPSNVIKTKEGVPSLTPSQPLYPDNGMVIAEIYVPQYPSLSSDQVNGLVSLNQTCYSLCRDTSLSCSVTPLANRRYTMQDIGKLDKRISNLEYYTQLSLLEKQAKDMTVTDANGLDRFKNGIFTDPFSNFALSDVANPEFNIAIDSQKGVARPKIIREFVNIQFTGGLNVQKTGRCVTLPYTEATTPFIRQPYATKYRSATHVAYAWNGTVTLFPSYNNHTDINQAGTVNMTVDTAQPWESFAQSPFAYHWGDWRTSIDTKVTTVLTGRVNTYNYNINYGWQSSHDLPAPDLTREQLYNVLMYNGINPGSDFVIGNIINQYSGAPAGGFPVLSLPPAGAAPAPQGGGDNGFALAWVIGVANGWW